MLRNPPDKLVELLGHETERRTHRAVSPDDAESFLRFLKVYTPRQIDDDSVQVSTDDEEGPNKFEQVDWVELDGDRLPVPLGAWRDALSLVCGKISRENRTLFDQVVQSQVWSSGGRRWFSRDANELRAAHRVAESELFVETMLSANNGRQLCDALSRLFGYGREVTVRLRE